MKIALFAAFICLAAALPKVRQIENLNYPGRIAGEYLVVLHAPLAKNSNFIYATKVSSRIAGISSKISVINMFTNLKAPILHLKTTDDSVMSQLFNMPEVDSITVNAEEHMIEQCSSQDTGSSLWGLSRSSSVSQPNYGSATYSYNSNDGSGNVAVYVLDTGIRHTHQDFGGRASFGIDFTNSNPNDNNGHGTHCAGTVGGTTYGVSKGVELIAVKVLGDSGSGQWAWSIAGLDYVVQQTQSRGIRGVASMSLGGGGNTGIDSAVTSADAAGVAVVVAGGNSNANSCNFSPARAQGAITVGATDISDNLSSFSNWGTCTDILAPGSSILSASHLSDTGSRTLSGTSMACPHVAGLCATYFSDNPDATTAQLKEYLRSTASADQINLRGTSGTPNLLMYASCA